MSAREEIIARITQALGPSPAEPEVARTYRTTGAAPAGDPTLLDLLAERIADYEATVRRASADAVASAVAAALAAHTPDGGRLRIVLPPGLPGDWLDEGLADTVTDDELSAEALDRLDGVVTGCAVAIAETGTLVLDGSEGQGRRALTLVPDLHVCVVTADQVVASVPEALARLDPRRPLTFVSGPSATSDIELNRVEGVHGPRTLEVVIVAPS